MRSRLAGPCAVAAFVVVVSSTARVVRADDADGRVLVETVADRAQVFVGEPFRVRVRVLWDEAWFAEHAAPLFQQPLGLQVRVEAPWLREIAGAEAVNVAAGFTPARPIRVAVNDGIVDAVRGDSVRRGDRTYAVLEVVRTYSAAEPQTISLAAPSVRFAWGTKFDEDFVHGRVALDRRDATVAGAAATIEVRALPEDGRPAGFRGAIGRFDVAATADLPPRELAVGETFRLTLRIRGEGNLTAFAPPPLDDLAGLHVYGFLDNGVLDDRAATTPGVRTLVYEMAALRDDVAAVPAIRLPHFDPGPPPAWRVAETAPLPLRMKRAATPPAPPAPEDDGRASPILTIVTGGLVVTAVLLLVLRQRRDAAKESPRTARIRTAAAAFAAASGPPADAFIAFLAAVLDAPAASVVTPDLRTRLATSGIPADLAARSAAHVERLVAARYGGTLPDDATATSRELVTAISSAAAASA